MKRSHALSLSGAALFLALASPSYAQSLGSGQQCVPAVANPSMYRNCNLRIVQGQEVCRCAVRPQALRSLDRLGDRDQSDAVTGSIGRSPVAVPGTNGALIGGPGRSNGGTIGNGSSGPSRGGAVADNGSSGGGTGGGSRGGGTTG